MNRRTLLMLLILAMPLTGAGLWLALSGPGAQTPGPAILAGLAEAAPDELDNTDQPDADTNSAGPSHTVISEAEILRPQPQPEAAEATDATDAEASRRGSQTAARPQPLNAHQREEQARVNGGRANHAFVVSHAAAAGSGLPQLASRFKKPLEADKWIESFNKEGLDPPDMVPTPIAGKVMSPISREGLAGARVLLVSCLPWAGKPGGELYPVVTEFMTDAAGEFKGDIPMPPRAPLGHPALGMLASAKADSTRASEAGEYIVISGRAIDGVQPGRFNQLGIFWAPEALLRVDCRAEGFASSSLSVVSTGALNPARWHDSTRNDAVFLFGLQEIGAPGSGEREGRCELRSTWDEKTPPYISLVDGKTVIQTRRCFEGQFAGGGGISARSSDPNAPKLSASWQQPFAELVFVPDNTGVITGHVSDVTGAPVGNAMITALGDPTPASTLTDAGGWFEIQNPGKAANSLRITHDDFITHEQSGVKPGNATLAIVLPHRKPVLWFMLRDRQTQAPVADVSVKLIERIEGKGSGKSPQPRTATHELTSATGEYVFNSEFAVSAMVLEKVGYFPRTINDPIGQQNAAGGRLDVQLNPGRLLDVRPRDFTAVQDTGRWFPDANNGPGIYSPWSHHWIEWTVDFGDAPEQGEEGGSFDILLGCTNQGLVDNDYRFEVEIYVDGTKKGNLSILANSAAIQTGRMKLGKISGSKPIRIVWLNDKWIPDQLDANIRLASLQFIEQP